MNENNFKNYWEIFDLLIKEYSIQNIDNLYLIIHNYKLPINLNQKYEKIFLEIFYFFIDKLNREIFLLTKKNLN